MATVKPTVDPKWSTNNVVTDNIEPLASIKDGGIVDGGVLGREHLNWQLNAISQWIDWVRAAALDKDSNLSELTNKNTARTNLELNTNATTLACNTSGNAGTATKLATARSIALTGDVEGTANFDGAANISITATVGNDSHTHNSSTISSITSTVAANAIADISGGAKGSYVFAQKISGGETLLGGSTSGSNLRTAHAYGSIEGPETTLSGTWRCMGMTETSSTSRQENATTLWLRIS